MFAHPWVLLLLIAVPVLAWRQWRHRKRGAIRFSSVANGWHSPPSWRQRVMWLPPALSLLALSLVIVALARPRLGREQTVVESEGIAIELIVDRSSSMQALDFKIAGQHVDRLTAIKNVARDFVLGEDAEESEEETPLPGRLSDLIGLISFAGYADALIPPTLDHGFLINELDEIRIAQTRREDGTAIGDAVALAVDKLSRLDQNGELEIESKVIILLTDGENTAGEIEPSQAAELANAMGIKIYTIGVGTKGFAPFPVRRSITGQLLVRQVEVNIDEATLREMAAATGGRYFRATDTESLASIYAEIDQLEKTKVETQSYVDYRELAVQSVRWHGYWVPALLHVAFWLLVARILLTHTLLRQLT